MFISWYIPGINPPLTLSEPKKSYKLSIYQGLWQFCFSCEMHNASEKKLRLWWTSELKTLGTLENACHRFLCDKVHSMYGNLQTFSRLRNLQYSNYVLNANIFFDKETREWYNDNQVFRRLCPFADIRYRKLTTMIVEGWHKNSKGDKTRGI